MSEVRERLSRDLAVVDWRSLRIHVQRSALILVGAQLDLVEVAEKVVNDAAAEIAAWIAAESLAKPTAEQLARWEVQLDKPFRMLIAAPYILIQEVQHA
jgi:hypothetical protein